MSSELLDFRAGTGSMSCNDSSDTFFGRVAKKILMSPAGETCSQGGNNNESTTDRGVANTRLDVLFEPRIGANLGFQRQQPKSGFHGSSGIVFLRNERRSFWWWSNHPCRRLRQLRFGCLWSRRMSDRRLCRRMQLRALRILPLSESLLGGL